MTNTIDKSPFNIKDRVIVTEQEDEPINIIIELTGVRIDEKVYTYDFNQNPVYVADNPTNKGCNANEEAIGIIREEILNNRFSSWEDKTESDFQKLIDNKRLDPIYYPYSRLEKIN